MVAGSYHMSVYTRLWARHPAFAQSGSGHCPMPPELLWYCMTAMMCFEKSVIYHTGAYGPVEFIISQHTFSADVKNLRRWLTVLLVNEVTVVQLESWRLNTPGIVEGSPEVFLSPPLQPGNFETCQAMSHWGSQQFFGNITQIDLT